MAPAAPRRARPPNRKKKVNMMTIRQVIERILAHDPSLGEEEKTTVATIKCGNPDVECTGVASCIAPSVDVIRQTAELGYNLIITHEPSFYTHEDTTDWLADNPVYRDKLALLDENGIVLWRYHDHIHAQKPDGIFNGVTAELGWQDYFVGDDFDRQILAKYRFPKTTPRKIAATLKEKIGLETLRVIGNPDAEVETAAFFFHVLGGPDGSQTSDRIPVQMMEAEGIDVLMPGELIDWTVASYVRDAAELGYPKAILATGHLNMEVLGMKYLPVWMEKVLGGEVPVCFVDAGDLYQYL